MREKIAVDPSGHANKMAVAENETLSAARTVTFEEVDRFNVLQFDPGGATRTVGLPAEEACAGVFLIIVNTADAATEDLTIQNDAGTPATVATVTQNEAALLVCDGTNWRSLVGANT